MWYVATAAPNRTQPTTCPWEISSQDHISCNDVASHVDDWEGNPSTASGPVKVCPHGSTALNSAIIDQQLLFSSWEYILVVRASRQ
jgi:hypothetical protein